MVLHDTVEKLTTWKKTLFVLSLRVSATLSSGVPLLTEGRLTEGSANKRSKYIAPTVLPRQKRSS